MKTMNRILATAIAAAGLLGTALPAYAKLTAAEAARLGADLTPMGAEKAGNKDGTIPAWTGGLCAPPAGWTPAKGYIDPFPNDKVKFTITKANAAQYKDKLTPGTLALLEKYDNFKMPVYETRRTACYPDSVYAERQGERAEARTRGLWHHRRPCGRAVPDPEERHRGDLESPAAFPRRRRRSRLQQLPGAGQW